MFNWIITYAVSLVAFLVIDGAWITLVARKLYELEAGDIMRKKPQLSAGILFYLLYVGGVLGYAVLPLTRHFNGIHAVFATYSMVAAWGAGLGLFAYATFSLTNQAVIKQWKYKLVVGDLLWGAVLTGIVTAIGFVVQRALIS